MDVLSILMSYRIAKRLNIYIMITSKEIKGREVTIDEAKNHSRREYNPSAWSRQIDFYAKYKECKFYLLEDDKLYAIYMPEDIRFLQEVSYSSCLSGAGFQEGYVFEDKIVFKRYENRMSIANTRENRKILAVNSKNFKPLFYYN